MNVKKNAKRSTSFVKNVHMLRDIENPSILRGNFFFFYNKSMFFLFIRIRLEPVVGKLVEKKEFIRHKYDTDKPC